MSENKSGFGQTISDIGSALPVVGGIISAISNIGAEGRQIKQQQKLMDQQIAGSKELSDYNKENTMDLWNRTNYEAQVEHLKKAGLNPSLLYGKGGGGGTITGGASSPMPTGGVAAGVDPNAKARNIMELGMMMANKKLIESQARLNTVEADKKEGVDTKEAQSRIDFNSINTKYANQSIEYRLDIIAQEANKAQAEAHRTQIAENVDELTMEANVRRIRQEATNAAIQAAAMEKGIDLDNAKINEISQGIQQKWQELNIKGTAVGYEHRDRLKAIEEYTMNALKVAGIHAIGNVVGDITEIATRGIPKQVLHK